MLEDDLGLDDELWALATTGEQNKKKRKKSDVGGGANASKRRRTDLSDDGEGSTEEEVKYPLEGKYIDAADKRRLDALPEMAREQILAQRLEEKQKITDKLNVTRLLAAQSGGLATLQDDSVAMAAKRQRKMVGSQKEKAHTRDALKAGRKAKEERRAQHHAQPRDSPTKRGRGRDSSDMEMDTSDEEDEDSPHPWTKSQAHPSKVKPVDEKIKLEDLSRIQITRSQLAKECHKPWFEDYVKDGYVRYLIGNSEGKSVYRICHIRNLGSKLVQPYKLENELVNQQLELAQGRSTRVFNMDKVSNAAFTEHEFTRWEKTWIFEHMPLPTLAQIQKKREQIKMLEEKRLTEADVSSIIARKRAINPDSKQSVQQRIAQGSRLRQELAAAHARGDKADVARVRVELESYNAQWGEGATGSGNESGGGGLLEEISKRNRKLNYEDAKRIEAERRKKAKLEMEKAKARTEMGNETVTSNDGSLIGTNVAADMEEMLKRNPEMAKKDFGTKMAHVVTIDLPGFF